MKPLNLATINISGLNLIEASAGTGKTWTIAALYILLLLEKELRPEQILVVTYTKAATAELRERIRRRITTTLDLYTSGRAANDDDLERLLLTVRSRNRERAVKLLTRALYSFDDAAIFTIHGFCQRALLENTFESGSLFGSDMISDQSVIVKQVCDDFWRTRILSQADDFVEHLAAEGITPEKLAKPFAGHFQNPDLIIVPRVEEEATEPLIIERDRLYAQACIFWNSDRSAIIAQLEHARLNQHSYKPAQIEAAAHAMDNWTAGGTAALPNSKLDVFSAQKIASKMTKASPAAPDHPFFTVCQQLSGVLVSLEHAYRNRVIACRHDFKRWLEQELSRRKKQLNQRAFDDLLLDLHLALEAESGPALADKLRQRYKAAMIDEFQDTDPLQWNIFKRVADQELEYPLFLIGDPKQAIYSFRGADVFAYLNAGKSVTTGNMHTLGTNFRSDAALVTAVSTLFAASPDPFMCHDIPFQAVESGRSTTDRLLVDGIPDAQPLKVWIYQRSDQSKAEAKPTATCKVVLAVAQEIARLLEAGRIAISTATQSRLLKPGDIAVLVKSHTQAELVQEALVALDIPSVQQGSTTIFETPEALDLLRIMRAVAEPHREALVREAMLTASFGLSANQVSEYAECSGEHPEWESWLLRFQALHKAAASGGVVALVSRLLGSGGVRTRMLSRNGGERCLTNILHCSELLHQIEREQGKSLPGLITWLERRISAPTKEDAALLRLETDENAVVISTIHASKGLQYPVVFVPFAWDAPSGKNDRALFHNDGDLILDLAKEDESLAHAAAERQAESARLLYVALTRAEFRCYTIWGAINGAVDSPLFHLLHAGSAAKKGTGFPAISDEEICADVQRLSVNGDAGISSEPMPLHTSGSRYEPAGAAHAPYSCRTPGHPPRDDWHVASFSGMTSGSGHILEPHDHDMIRDTTAGAPAAAPTASEAPSGGLTIFDFPRGALAGTCLHEIFELLDYPRLSSDSIAATARASLAGSGFHDQWLPAIGSMVTNVSSAPIIPDNPDFSLSRLQKGEWQTEMEFYLPVKQLSPDVLMSLFEGILDEGLFADYYEVLNSLSFRQSRGMLQGFIDLVFTHNERFYILDWKSNHLGMKTSDYSQEKMHESMCRSAYILQYHLYTLALDRLLKIRLPGYSYEKHFGGALYLYLRGITAGSANEGIYAGRPHPEFMRRAGNMLLD